MNVIFVCFKPLRIIKYANTSFVCTTLNLSRLCEWMGDCITRLAATKKWPECEIVFQRFFHYSNFQLEYGVQMFSFWEMLLTFVICARDAQNHIHRCLTRLCDCSQYKLITGAGINFLFLRKRVKMCLIYIKSHIFTWPWNGSKLRVELSKNQPYLSG